MIYILLGQQKTFGKRCLFWGERVTHFGPDAGGPSCCWLGVALARSTWGCCCISEWSVLLVSEGDFVCYFFHFGPEAAEALAPSDPLWCRSCVLLRASPSISRLTSLQNKGGMGRGCERRRKKTTEFIKRNAHKHTSTHTRKHALSNRSAL